MSDERVLLITGASSGIGKATARLMKDERRLSLAARRPGPLDELRDELAGSGDEGKRVIACPCDVGEWDQVEALTATTLESFGRIDEVFVNAGFGATRGFLEETPEHWKAMVQTNVLGAALTIRSTLPHLLERGSGHYVVTSSIAGRRVLPGSLYSATKFAATAIGEALRQELRGRDDGNRIKVTLIEPGMVDTDFFDDRPGDSALADADVARAVKFALDQPETVDVNEILVRPITQAT